MAGLTVPPELSSRLVTYLDVLERWNRKINLTSLSDPNEAVDRLLLEPLAAAAHLRSGSALADLGSGGGSPAIPLALALGSRHLLMVESRSRKAAFLREVARTLELDATVRSERFQDVVRDSILKSAFDIVSIRALRVDGETLTAAQELLGAEGTVALFRATAQPFEVRSGFIVGETCPLVRPDSSLVILHRRA
jgi:16S rRNA (guanine527-N7)-methyltransferase